MRLIYPRTGDSDLPTAIPNFIEAGAILEAAKCCLELGKHREGLLTLCDTRLSLVAVLGIENNVQQSTGSELNESPHKGKRLDCSKLPQVEQETCFSATRKKLAASYPGIDAGSKKPENKKILCPFLRMLERAGLFDQEKKVQTDLTVPVRDLVENTREFGCTLVSCGAVASAVAVGQLTQFSTSVGKVNVEKLHKAIGVAHDCGFSFVKGGEIVDDATRAKTLSRFLARANSQGRLLFSDIKAVKLQICAEQGVKLSLAGGVEDGLIYTFLGGNERGFVDYDDIDRLFHAELPNIMGDPGKPNASAK